MSVYAKLVKAYRVGVPLVSFETSDPGATNQAIVAEFASAKFQEQINIVAWDCVRGWYVFTPKTSTGNLKGQDEYVGNPLELLVDLAKVDQSLPMVILIHNAHQFLDQFTVVQAIWNLRDIFKSGQKMLVLMGSGGRLPVELQQDVIAIIEPLPDSKQLSQVIGSVCDAAEIEASQDVRDAAGCAALGVTAFAAENLASLAIDKHGLSMGGLWESKEKKINETPALQVVSGSNSMDKIGGIPQFKKFIAQVIAGKSGINAIVFIDEIEKALGAAGTDMSGTSQDQVGTLLSWMQDNRATGCILVGPPGASKSAAAKACGSDQSIPTIQLDLGAAKGSLVGQSEQQIREALKVINAVSGGKTLWIATCNSLSVLPPELKRRFKLGTWFFDLPDLEERNEIWKIYREKFGLTAEQTKALHANEWTGAEIETCCELAHNLEIEPIEAAEYIVPVSKHAADSIEKLRAGAEGRFLSASYPGTYQRTKPEASKALTGRRFQKA